jgi:Polyketide cyclase / dehydrase and lipid transport
MPTASIFVPRSPADCWRHFTDAATLMAWVPGLRRARTVAVGADGLPLEVAFEFSESRTYSLVYRYQLEPRLVSWQPRIGLRDAVSGSARFDAEDAGTRVTYTTERGDSRSPAEREIDDPAVLLAAFAGWMGKAR